MPGKRKFTKGGKGKAKKKKKKGAKDWSYYDDFGQDDKAIAAAKKEQNKIKYGDIGFSKPVESTAVPTESSSSDEFYDSDSDVDTAYDILVASAKEDAAANSTMYSRLLKQQSLEEEGKSEDSDDSEEEEGYIHEREEEQYERNDLDQEDQDMQKARPIAATKTGAKQTKKSN